MKARYGQNTPSFMDHIDPELLLEAISVTTGVDRALIHGFGTTNEDEHGMVQIDMHLQYQMTQMELNRIYDACWKESNG